MAANTAHVVSAACTKYQTLSCRRRERKHILGWVWREGECEHVLGRADGVGMWFFNDAWQKAIVKVALFGASHT